MNTIEQKRIIGMQVLAAIKSQTPFSIRQLAKGVKISRPTVNKVVDAIKASPKSFEGIERMSHSALSIALTPSTRRKHIFEIPDFEKISAQMKQYGFDKQTAFKIYCDEAEGRVMSRSTFYDWFKNYCGNLEPAMRHQYLPGQVAFVDFAGKKSFIQDPQSGDKTSVEIFAGVLGYSGYAFVCACPSQSQESFANANVAMINYFGRAPRYIVPDNLKAAVVKTGKNRVLNALYEELGMHYGTLIIPARVYRPKDKAAAEALVRHTYIYILSRLRNQVFFSIEELNAAILPLLAEFNAKPFCKRIGSRLSLFRDKEYAALITLPEMEFEIFTKRVKRKVSKQYVVNFDNHFYSVPYTLIGHTLDVKANSKKICCFYDGELVAEHPISFEFGGFTIDSAHMPESHREYAKLNQTELFQWAQGVGPATEKLIAAQFNDAVDSTPDVKKRCSRFKALAKKHGFEAFEGAAKRAEVCATSSYRFMEAVLKPVNHNTNLH